MMKSWIDINGLVRMYEYLLERKFIGLFNATALNPVSNNEFTKALGAQLKRVTIFLIFLFVLKFFFGEGATVLTASKEIYSKRLLGSGFEFKYLDIQISLAHFLSKID